MTAAELYNYYRELKKFALITHRNNQTYRITGIKRSKVDGLWSTTVQYVNNDDKDLVEIFERSIDNFGNFKPVNPLGQEQRTVDFSEALRAIKRGCQVARKGWNGKGMKLFLVKGSTFVTNREPLNTVIGEGKKVTYQPHIDMLTADGTVVPWVSSQSDALAEDWVILS